MPSDKERKMQEFMREAMKNMPTGKEREQKASRLAELAKAELAKRGAAKPTPKKSFFASLLSLFEP